MNVTVITTEPMDFGWGPDTRIEFVDSKYVAKADAEGRMSLHIQSERQGGSDQIASFQYDEWRCVIRGDVVEHPKAGQPASDGRVAPLTRVQGGAQ